MTLFDLPQLLVYVAEHIVVLAGLGIEFNSLFQRLGCQTPFLPASVRLSHLKISRTGLGINGHCGLSFSERQTRLAKAIVKGTQVDEWPLVLQSLLLAELDSVLIAGDRRGIVAESFLSKSQVVEGLDVGGVKPDCRLEFLLGQWMASVSVINPA